MADLAALLADQTGLIRRAIADPGQFCKRDKTWDDGWEEWDPESIPSWCSRAVVLALTDVMGAGS